VRESSGGDAAWADQVRRALEHGGVIGESTADSPGGDSDIEHPPRGRAVIPASEVRQALVSRARPSDPRGVEFRGVRLSGVLDLASVEGLPPLRFRSCQFDAAPVFANASVASLAIERCSLPGLDLRGIAVHGDLRLIGIDADGTVDAEDARIGRQLLLSEATLHQPDGVALVLSGASIGGRVALDRLNAVGEVNAIGVRSGGEMDLTDAVIALPETREVRTVLRLGGADIGGNLQLARMVTHGEVRAPGIRVAGQVDAADAQLTGRAGRALQLNRARIEGSLFLENAVVHADVRIIGAKIGGQLFLSGSRLSSDAFALLLGGTEVAGNVYLIGARFTGLFSARGAVIRGRIRARDATFTDPGWAIEFDRMTVEGDIELTGATVTGKASMAGSFRTSLDLTDATFGRLSLAEADIGTLVLDGTTADGIDFSGTSITHLVTGRRPLPRIVTAHGWRVGMLGAASRSSTAAAPAGASEQSGPLTRDEATRWLDGAQAQSAAGSSGFSQQPWKALAQAFADLGQPEDARRLRFRASRRATRAASPFARAPRRLYGATVGYGYYPGLVVFWLAGLYLVALTAASIAVFQPTRPDATTAGDKVIPWLFAVDTALPAAATGEAAAWSVVDPFWGLLFGAIRVVGWVLISLLIAGVTGIIRKD